MLFVFTPSASVLPRSTYIRHASGAASDDDEQHRVHARDADGTTSAASRDGPPLPDAHDVTPAHAAAVQSAPDGQKRIQSALSVRRKKQQPDKVSQPVVDGGNSTSEMKLFMQSDTGMLLHLQCKKEEIALERQRTHSATSLVRCVASKDLITTTRSMHCLFMKPTTTKYTPSEYLILINYKRPKGYLFIIM